MHKCQILSSQQRNHFYISKIKELMLYKLPCEICGFDRHDVEDTSPPEIYAVWEVISHTLEKSYLEDKGFAFVRNSGIC